MQLTINGFATRSRTVPKTIRYYREEVMELGEIVKLRTIRRFHSEGKERSTGTLFTDICYAEEQLIDCCDMIAEALLRYHVESEDGEKDDFENDGKLRQQVHDIFKDKYEMLEELGR